MARVTHFEIHAEVPSRAIGFYSSVFEWQFTKWGGPVEYWLVRTGNASEPGIDGGLVRRRGAIDGLAVIAFVCSIKVDDVAAYERRIAEAGGEIVVPKTPIPGVGWLAYAKDTEGNVFGVTQDDASA